MSSVKVTSKGTELPLLNLKGKPYLQVAHRLVWFREDHPLGRICTQVIERSTTHAVVKAEIYSTSVGQDGGPISLLLSSAHKTENEGNFGDFLEKAETGAIGRALAMAGYGTQFEPELDEGDRLADAPIEPARKVVQAKEKPSVANKDSEAPKENGRLVLNRTIRTTGRVLNDKKIMTLDETAKAVASYGVKVVEDLSDMQAQELLTTLQGKLK